MVITTPGEFVVASLTKQAPPLHQITYAHFGLICQYALCFSGPKGADGYPERIWDKRTGLINKTTAAYWKEHFDLQHILERDAAVLAPKLANKIHLFVGASDTFFLTDAVMDMQDFLKGDAGKVYNATVLIGTHEGRGFEHCFNGYGKAMGDTAPLPNSVSGVDPSMHSSRHFCFGFDLFLPKALILASAAYFIESKVTRNYYNQKFVPEAARHFLATAPAGADISWSKY